jgi:hypothetical protein
MAQTGEGQVPDGVTANNDAARQDEDIGTILRRLAREFLPPLIILIFLFFLVLGFFILAWMVDFILPEGLQQFIFLVFVFFGFGVFITRVLMEAFQIQINGWALSGTLAVMFVLTYFITEKFDAVAEILGFVKPAPIVERPGLPQHTLAEVRLDCDVGPGGDEPEERFVRQSENLYTFIDGASDYIRYVRGELGKLGRHRDYQTRIITSEMPEYPFFADVSHEFNSASWIAYAVPHESLVEGFIPIPTQLNKLHKTAFFIDAVVPGADAAGNVHQSLLNTAPNIAGNNRPAQLDREFVEVAKLVIEPGQLESPPANADATRANGSADDTLDSDTVLRAQHKIKLIVNVVGGKVSCWTPATVNF